MRVFDAEDLITEEYHRASALYGKFNSAHEGFAVLKEEVDELWDEIKKKQQDTEHLRKEAMQVGAMALRFLVDLCEPPYDEVRKGATVVSIAK